MTYLFAGTGSILHRDAAFFTEESRFCIERGNGRAGVWLRKVERYAQNCILERSRNSGGSMMVRGGILKD